MDYHREIDGFYTRRGEGTANFENYLRYCMACDDTLALAALQEGEVVGYSISRKSEHPPVFEIQAYGLIADMAVKAGHRRKGTGSLMLARILEWFDSLSMSRAELHVAFGNPVGYSFWSKHGFKDYERVLYLQR